MQPPTQELVVRDLHDNTWTFRHIYRGKHAGIISVSFHSYTVQIIFLEVTFSVFEGLY